MKNEIKVKVLFGENRIVDGTMYGKGVIELSPEKAISAVANGGVVSAADRKILDNFSEAANNENAPLSIEETLERFDAGDFSDDVMRSMQYHQSEILEIKNGNKPRPLYGDVRKSKETTFSSESGKEKIPPPPSGNSQTGGTGEGNQAGDQTGGNAETGNAETGNAETGNAGTGGAANQNSENQNSEAGNEAEPPNDLPEGLPYRKELLAGKVTSFEKLKAMKRAEVLDIAEIGDAKANKIGAWIAANS